MCFGVIAPVLLASGLTLTTGGYPMKRGGSIALGVTVVAAAALVWMAVLRPEIAQQANESLIPPPAATAPGVARATTALAAVLLAAGQVADDEAEDRLRRFQLLHPSYPAVEEAFPQRQRLVEAVSGWPDEQKQAALEWVRDHAVWSTLLHAMAIESFDESLVPTEWGPSMSRFDHGIFEARAGLSPLLVQALADPAIAALARELSAKQEPFTAAAVAKRRSRILEYLRLPDDLPTFDAFFATLMPPGTGANVELENGSLLFLVGPLADPVEVGMVLSHEMAHQPIYRIVEQPDVRAALESSACAFAGVSDHHGYQEWGSYFSESLVRSLSYRLEGLPAFDPGFRFEAELYRELQAWEEGDEANFAQALIGMLDRIREAHCLAVGIAADGNGQ